MEVKVGIHMAPRELVVDTRASAQEITEALTAALADGKLFVLTDTKGNTVLVPADKIAYVELGVTGQRHIGFGTS